MPREISSPTKPVPVRLIWIGTSRFSRSRDPTCTSAGSTPSGVPQGASSRPPPIHDAPGARRLSDGARRPAGIFGVPMDLGQDRRGVDMGPSAIRYARLQAALEELGYPVTDLGNAATPIPELMTKGEVATEARNKEGEVRHLEAVRDVCLRVAERAEDMVTEGYFPSFLGGDHSISIGTVSG